MLVYMRFYMPLYIKETMFSWDIFLRSVDIPSYFSVYWEASPSHCHHPGEKAEIQEGRSRFGSYDFVIWSETVALPLTRSGIRTISTGRSLLKWALSLLWPKPTRCGPCNKVLLQHTNSKQRTRSMCYNKNNDKRQSFSVF